MSVYCVVLVSTYPSNEARAIFSIPHCVDTFVSYIAQGQKIVFS